MNLICTWSFKPMIDGTRLGAINRFDTLVFLYMADKSISTFRECFGFNPTLYTDSIGEKVLSFTGCNIINCYDNIYDNISTKLWAYPKIITYSKQEDPYLHFDLDFILKQPISIPDCDVYVQCPDTYKDTFTNDLNSTGLSLPKEFDNKLLDNSFTMGIFGMFDMELNHKYANASLKYFNDNNSTVNDWRSVTMTNTVLEQQLLAVMASDSEVRYLCEDACFENDYFKHYVSTTKKSDFARNFLHDKIEQKHHDANRILINELQSKSKEDTNN